MKPYPIPLPLELPLPKMLQIDRIMEASAVHEPFPYLTAADVLSQEMAHALKRDFPSIEKAGFFPLGTMKCSGSFRALIRELQGSELAEALSLKFDIELRDKPSMITVRQWSAAKDGRIHNDGASKIVTALLYLNDAWPEDTDGGRFRVLRSNRSFDDSAAEIPPLFGNFVAFRRAENSWHGHKPFTGERRVVQITWLKSWEDLERKEKRGRLSLFLKKLSPVS